MLTVTDAAAEFLFSLLEETEAADHVVARIQPGENGLGLIFDQLQAEDTTFEHNGRTVLGFDERISNALTNNTLDVNDTGEGPKLALSKNAPH